MTSATLVPLAAAALSAGPALAPAKAAAATTKTATHTTKTGKTITYDCSKKGNANKTACKRK